MDTLQQCALWSGGSLRRGKQVMRSRPIGGEIRRIWPGHISDLGVIFVYGAVHNIVGRPVFVDNTHMAWAPISRRFGKSKHRRIRHKRITFHNLNIISVKHEPI